MSTRALVALAVVAACSDKKPVAPAAVAEPTRATAGASQPAMAGATLVPETTQQLVTAIVDTWTSTRATVQLWQRSGTTWRAAGEPWPAVIGHAGSAWGAGMHGTGAPGREGPIKREGDGKSPAGAFAIRRTYGYADDPPAGARLPYTSAGHGDLECIHDPGSEHYAKIVDRKQVAGDWESAEQMLRDDVLYTWVVDLAHNPERTPKLGSCIFLHVWSGPESTTLGCTAMAQSRLLALLRELDPAAKPAFVLLPRAEYQALAVAWGLPPQ